jgi:DNA-directed RNA polymerase specialized sigma24 family protein
MPPDEAGSVTQWIPLLKAGDGGAADALWDRYFAELVRLARARLRNTHAAGPDIDEEDAALSAFAALCRGAQEGRFPDLDDRDGLWRLLVRITADKICDQARRRARLKRGGGRVLHEADLVGAETDGGTAGLDAIAGREPNPAIAALLADEARRRLDDLGNEALRRVASLKLEGHTVDEIAAHLGCARRTVMNRLKLIRMKWQEGGRRPESEMHEQAPSREAGLDGAGS